MGDMPDKQVTADTLGQSSLAKKIDLGGFGYQSVAHIGRGHTASAQVVRDLETGQEFVAKCVSLATLTEHDQEFAKQEAFLLQSLRNPLIVAYHDSFLIEGANTLVIVMEHCSGGDLRAVIKSKAASNEQFSEDQVMSWFVQIALALQFIHSHKILHRDLKTSNIFVSENSSMVKLGDFGLSRVLERTTDAAVTMVGTPYYMSPEVCSNAPYNWKSDVWSLGCVLYEMCMLKHAFESSSLFGLVYKIVSGNYEPIPSVYSQDLNDLIGRLLTKSALDRPSISQIFAIPYVKAHVEKVKSALVGIPSPKPPPAPATPAPPKSKKRRAWTTTTAEGAQTSAAAKSRVRVVDLGSTSCASFFCLGRKLGCTTVGFPHTSTLGITENELVVSFGVLR